jgi:hypothetical protein
MFNFDINLSRRNDYNYVIRSRTNSLYDYTVTKNHNIPHTFAEVAINDNGFLGDLSTKEQEAFKISIFTDHVAVCSRSTPPLPNIKFIVSVVKYEWNYKKLPEENKVFYLSIVLEIIDKYGDLFPITIKLEHMLREVWPMLTNPFNSRYIDLVYNEKLLDLCNDVGLFDKNQNGYFYELKIFTPTHVRKGLHSHERRYHRLCLYIQSVMITT